MSDDNEPDADDRPDEPTDRPDDPDEATDDTGENPPVEDDELADLGSVADEIEETAQSQQESPDGEEDESVDDDDQEDDPLDRNIDPTEADISLGKVYTNALGMSAAVARGRYGDLDDHDRDEIADEYAEMARQIELDVYFDQWMAERAGFEDATPGEAILFGTLVWGAMVMLDDPSMAETAVSGVRA